MPRGDAPRKPWTSDGRWKVRSVGAWEDTEWSQWQELAQLAGKSTNGWIRGACNEVARYESLNLEDKGPDAKGPAS